MTLHRYCAAPRTRPVDEIDTAAVLAVLKPLWGTIPETAKVGEAPPGTSDYQSHYNKALNKCFILIKQMSELNGQPVMATELYDAIERRVLASYIQLTKEGKEYLRNCELKPTLQEKETICGSKQEFDAFVSKYMEQ